ncbi:MAG: nuclear transport factor 2 family protein [Acidobacteria bacterium]|nr:nuclear transport factor 2 family protein [Acidobacteriota bacterium]
MKYLIFRFTVSLLTFIIGLASASMLNPFRNHQAEQEILRVEREYVAAHLNGDAAALEEILADDFVIRSQDRTISTKAMRLALLERRSFTFDALDTSDVDVRVNGNSATVTGRAYIRVGYSSSARLYEASYGFTRLYEKRDGRWQIVSVTVDD